MSEEAKIDTLTNKITEFSNSKSGNVILDFVMFKRNILQYTLQIAYVAGVLCAWVVAILGIFNQGPLGGMFVSKVLKDGKPVESFNFIEALLFSVVVFVLAPFVLHYALELVMKVVWPFLVHLYEKIVYPIWNTIVVRFFANVAPQVLPFLYERAMKLIDIVIDKVAPLADVVIDCLGAVFVAIAGILKGVIWLPVKIGEGLDKWMGKAKDSDAQAK